MVSAQPPPKLAWGGDETQEGTTAPPPWGGLSKPQLDVAAYETLLLALSVDEDSHTCDAGDAGSKAREETVRCFAAQLGIGSKQHRRLHVRAPSVTPSAPRP